MDTLDKFNKLIYLSYLLFIKVESFGWNNRENEADIKVIYMSSHNKQLIIHALFLMENIPFGNALQLYLILIVTLDKKCL